MKERVSDVFIRAFRDSDKQAVASLYADVFGESAMQAFMKRWDWQFNSNPCADRLESLMWVAELGGNAAGFLASFPCQLKVIERDALIRLPSDLMVSGDARGRGVGERLFGAYMASEHVILSALGYTEASGRMFRRLGFQPVDAERLRMRPLGLPALLRDALLRDPGSRLAAALAPMITGVGGVLNLGLRLFNRAMMPARSADFEIRQCTVADERFDDLWHRASPAFPIAAVRDRRWVQWRFLDDPCFNHQLLCAYDHQGELAGYVDVRVSRRRGLRIGRILDLFCDPRTAGVAASLLVAGTRCLEGEGVDVITCLGHLPGLQRLIPRICYLTPKRLQKPALLLWKGDAALAGDVYDAHNWHLTHADGDDGFSP